MSATRWEKRSNGEGRKPVPGRAFTGYIESTVKGVKKPVQQWCYVCGKEHPYHTEGNT